MQAATATATMYVPNPLRERIPQLRVLERELTYIEDRIKVGRALRDDPLGQMHQRKQIGEAQYQAGRKFQSTWEAAGTPLRSSGNIIEHVDGGRGASDGITDARMAAGKSLALWRKILGHEYALVEAVLIDKRSIRELADTGSMMPGKAATTFTGHLFRRQLTVLAKAMGFG